MWIAIIGSLVGFIGYLAYYFIKQAVEKRKNNKVDTPPIE